MPETKALPATRRIGVAMSAGSCATASDPAARDSRTASITEEGKIGVTFR